MATTINEQVQALEEWRENMLNAYHYARWIRMPRWDAIVFAWRYR